MIKRLGAQSWVARWDKYEFEQLMSCLIEDHSLYKQSQFSGVQLNLKAVSLLKKVSDRFLR